MYEGTAVAKEARHTIPVTIVWVLREAGPHLDEVKGLVVYVEGATKTVQVNSR